MTKINSISNIYRENILSYEGVLNTNVSFGKRNKENAEQ